MANQATDAIPTWYVRGYQAGVRMLQQQKVSRMRNAVLVDEETNENRRFYDHAGETEMHDVENRHGNTEYDDHPLTRRLITTKTKEVAKLVDRRDRRRLLNDPINPYTKMQAAAANRKIDDVVLVAFDADAKAGEDGDTTVSFDATNFSFSEATAEAFAVEDLSKARAILEEFENDEDDGDESWHIVCASDQRENLRKDPTLTSNDYAMVKALVEGQIHRYMGLEFHRSQRAPKVAQIRDVYVWVKQSMQLAVNEDFTSFIDVLPQKRHSIQVRTELDIGSTRMDEEGVVRILVDEGA